MTLTAQYRPYKDEDGMDGDHIGWSEHEPSIQIYEKNAEPKSFKKRTFPWMLSFITIAGIFGFIIGYFCHKTHSDCGIHDALINNDENYQFIRQKLLNDISSENIGIYSREFSKNPHLASSPEDQHLAEKILNFFKSNNFDRAVLKNYTSLISLPDPNKPNFVSLIDASGREFYSSAKSSQQPFFSPYSPIGDITGEILFVNYGRSVDYLQLQNLFNNTDIFSGKIFLVKQFHLSASEQYKFAVALNASALLLYPDPQHYNPKNVKGYPDSIWLPPDGVRNDGVFWNGAGDPETFGLPSNFYAFRNKFNEQMTIPAQPISYETAYEIFKNLDGMKAPADWTGGFNITYHIGPAMKNDIKVRVSVNNRLIRKTIHNVIGRIYGRLEPDRYVIIGSQRDSLSNGAIDSATGVGTFLEIARTFGNLVATGWRPARSILFCSWGAEEFNLIGSTEFVEESFKILYMRAVAYININLVVNGNDTLSVAASPLLYHLIFNATKDIFLPKIPGEDLPNNEFNSIYDRWIVSMPKLRNTSSLAFQPNMFNQLNLYNVYEKIAEQELKHEVNHVHQKESIEPGSILKTYLESTFQQIRPYIRPLDMYGSYAPFYTIAGIPVLDACFINIDPEDKFDEQNEDVERIGFPNHLPYPLLHTQYDQIEAVEKFVDPDYKYHYTVAQLLTYITERLADSTFLPFNIFDYAQILKDFLLKTQHVHSIIVMSSKHHNFEVTETTADLQIMDIDLRSLESAIKNFTKEAIKFHARQDHVNINDPMIIRQINDKLLLLERQFLDHRGIPNNNMKRHLILSPAETNSPMKHDGLFPALLDELDQIMGTVFKDEIQNSLLRLQKHLPILVNTIQEAANSLAFSEDF